MNALAIDTSGKNLTVVVIKDSVPYVYHDDKCGINHSVEIMPKIEELVLSSGLDLSSADFIACVVGAGSFTGIRIGVATAKALCFAYNLPCLSVTSFDTIAYNKQGGKILSIINAKHDCFYVCGYNDKVVDLEPSFIDLKQLKTLKRKYDFLSSEKIEGVKTQVVSVSEGLVNAVKENKDKTFRDLDLLVPLYIRKSQAEERR